MGKLIIISKEKENNLAVYLNNQLICNLNGIETKCFEVNNDVYQINCSSASSTKSETETVDLNKDAKILVSQGFNKPEMYSGNISEEEIKEYEKYEFTKLDSINQNISIKQDLKSCKKDSHKTSKSFNVFFVIFCIISGILSVFVIFVLACTFLLDGNSEKDAASTDRIIQKNIGDTLDCGDYVATIDKILMKTGAIDSIQRVPDGHEWIGLIVTVQNNSDKEKHIFNDDFEIINSNGERIKHQTIVYNVFDDYEKLSSPTLVPDGSKTGFISFDNNNQDNSNLTIELKCNSISWFNSDPIYQIKYSE